MHFYIQWLVFIYFGFCLFLAQHLIQVYKNVAKSKTEERDFSIARSQTIISDKQSYSYYFLFEYKGTAQPKEVSGSKKNIFFLLFTSYQASCSIIIINYCTIAEIKARLHYF